MTQDRTIAQLQADVTQLRAEVATLTEATQQLVDAWKAAGALLRFVKWTSTVAAAAGSLWAVFHSIPKLGG